MFKNISTVGADIIQFGKNKIPWTNSVKYLGVKIDKILKFNGHVKEIVGKANVAKSTLYTFLHERSPLSLRTKLYVLKTYIRPIILYAGAAWSENISKISWDKIESSINYPQKDNRQPLVRCKQNNQDYHKSKLN